MDEPESRREDHGSRPKPDKPRQGGLQIAAKQHFFAERDQEERRSPGAAVGQNIEGRPEERRSDGEVAETGRAADQDRAGNNAREYSRHKPRKGVRVAQAIGADAA